MKTFYSILAVALMSVSVFASNDVVPRNASSGDDLSEMILVFMVGVPRENAPETIEIIGSFDNWRGTPLECHYDEHGFLLGGVKEFDPASIMSPHTFKIRGTGSWDKQIEKYNKEADTWEPLPEFVFGQIWEDESWHGEVCKMVNLSWSDPKLYRWTDNTVEVELTVSCDEMYGKVSGSGKYPIGTELTISAEANYGYHFVKWSDDNTDNPRTIILNEAMNLTAIFAPNTYTISGICNPEQGYITGTGEYEYLTTVTVKAVPVQGYQFTKWGDGDEDYIRYIEVTKDIELEALFDYQLSGICGTYNALRWTFDPSDMSLIITGNGSLADHYTYGNFIKSLKIGNEVTVIGNSAFAEFADLTHIVLGSSVNKLEENAFYNCSSVRTIICDHIYPPTIRPNALYGLEHSTIVYVSADYLNSYKRHSTWGLFDVRPLEATATKLIDDEINIATSDTTANISWPAVENAAIYELTIKDKNGNVICTLTFNAQGQLTNIVYAAPSRAQTDGQIAGFTFTISGLDSDSEYSYSVTAKDAQGEVLDTKEGSFTTTESGIATAVDNASVDTKPVKLLRNGQLFILRGDKTYTVQGQEVR